MTFKETMATIFSASEGAYYKWKREKRPIILLLEKYFSKGELEEFLETGKIEKFEKIREFEMEGERIYNQFFFEYYSRKPMNQDFLNVIFPEFEIFIKNKVETRKVEIEQNIKKNIIEQKDNPKLKDWIEQQKYFIQMENVKKHFHRSSLISFIISENLKEDIDKTSSILAISNFTDFEIRLLLSSYKQFKSTE